MIIQFFSNSMIFTCMELFSDFQGLEVIKLEFNLKLKIKRNDWLLAESLCFNLSLRMDSSFITSRPGFP